MGNTHLESADAMVGNKEFRYRYCEGNSRVDALLVVRCKPIMNHTYTKEHNQCFISILHQWYTIAHTHTHTLKTTCDTIQPCRVELYNILHSWYNSSYMSFGSSQSGLQPQCTC